MTSSMAIGTVSPDHERPIDTVLPYDFLVRLHPHPPDECGNLENLYLSSAGDQIALFDDVVLKVGNNQRIELAA